MAASSSESQGRGGLTQHRIIIVMLLSYIAWSGGAKTLSGFLSAAASGSTLFVATTTATGGASTLAGAAAPATGNSSYRPAAAEAYILSHLEALGYNTSHGQTAPGCVVWRNDSHPELYNNLQAYRPEILKYGERIRDFAALDSDLRDHMSDVFDADAQHRLCQSVEVQPTDGGSGGLAALFPSGQLSYSGRGGYAEPLAPPMRHPEFCFYPNRKQLMRLDYIIHDFGSLCRQLRKTSRVVLFDMGASLTFHDGQRSSSPALFLADLFRKFGFWFDHVYAFEATLADPPKVFNRIPKELLSAYHWYNIPVTSTVGATSNPLTLLKEEFTPEDIVLVKLDVDTPSLELPLVRQILDDPELWPLIDHFYFEHHVHLAELAPNWKVMGGSLADTIRLFHELRTKGIISHYWV